MGPSKYNLEGTTILFSPKTIHDKLNKLLKPKFALAETIPSILKYHTIILFAKNQLILKELSYNKGRHLFPKEKKK